MFRCWPGGCSLFRVTNARLGPKQRCDHGKAWGSVLRARPRCASLPRRVLLKTKRSSIDSMVASRWNTTACVDYPRELPGFSAGPPSAVPTRRRLSLREEAGMASYKQTYYSLRKYAWKADLVFLLSAFAFVCASFLVLLW
jgi:hypothetical protein